MNDNPSHNITGKLFDELTKMPEYHLFLQLRTLNTPIYIFEQNYIELRKLIKFVTEDPNGQMLGTMRYTDKLEQIHLDIVRRLHNFVASVLSLIDHTRHLHKKLYEGTDIFSEYQAKVKQEFESDPLSQFVIKFRQYCQHYQSPDIGTTFSLIRVGNKLHEERVVVLFSRNLRRFDGWNAEAKEYLNSVGDEIDILKLLTAYREKVIKFYQWFQSRQADIHSKDLEKYYRKQAEFALHEIEWRIDSRLKNRDSRIRLEEEVFSGIFPSIELERLESMKTNRKEKAEFAINLLEKQYSLPESMKKKIEELYLQEENGTEAT